MVNTPERSRGRIGPGYSPVVPDNDMSNVSDLAGLPEDSQDTTDTTDSNNTNTNDREDEDFILVPRNSSPHIPASTTPNRATSLSPMLQRDPLESALHPEPQWDVTPPSLRRAFQGAGYSPATPNSAASLSPARQGVPLSPLQPGSQESGGDSGPIITPPSLRRRQNMLVWDEAELSWVARRRLSFVEEGEEDEGNDGEESEEYELLERSGEAGDGSDAGGDEHVEARDGSDGRGAREGGQGGRENNVDITGGQGVGGGCAC